MKNLKESLLKEGYVTFNINEYFPEYIKNLEYIKNECESLTKWRLFISSIFDKKEHNDFESYIKENYYNFVNWKNVINNLHDDGSEKIGYEITVDCNSLKMMDDIQKNISELVKHESLLQYWFYENYYFTSESPNHTDIILNVENLFDGVFSKFYDGEYSKDGNSKFSLTNFRKDCHIHSHADGQSEERICGMLFYLNSNFNKETGGNLILNDTIEVPAEFGTVTILDYTKHNIQHEVSRVTELKNRFALLKFFEKKSNIE